MSREVKRVLALTGVLLTVWLTFASFSQRSYDWPGALAAALLIALLGRLLSGLHPAREIPSAVPPSRPRPELPQVRGVLLMRERVRWAQEDPGRFTQVVTPLLRELVDERLARRGLHRDRDWETVTRLIGGDLMALLEGPAPTMVPAPAWLDDVMGRIERL